MPWKRFDDYIKTRLSSEEIEEIKKKAEMEVRILKRKYKKSKFAGDLIASLKEAIAHKEGKLKLRTIEIEYE